MATDDDDDNDNDDGDGDDDDDDDDNPVQGIPPNHVFVDKICRHSDLYSDFVVQSM